MARPGADLENPKIVILPARESFFGYFFCIFFAFLHFFRIFLHFSDLESFNIPPPRPSPLLAYMLSGYYLLSKALAAFTP